jgi:hypothetical protein
MTFDRRFRSDFGHVTVSINATDQFLDVTFKDSTRGRNAILFGLSSLMPLIFYNLKVGLACVVVFSGWRRILQVSDS